MGCKQKSKLLEIAESYVGYLEKKSNAQLEDFTANAGSGNWTKFGEWYGSGKNGYAWCAMFVSFCASMAGVSTDTIPKHHGCGQGVSWFKQRGRWHPRAGYKPEPGDIIYFTQDGVKAAHVGIVRAVNNGRVYTVEGNTSGGSTLLANGGGVAKKDYPLGYAGILGYGNPAYVDEIASVSAKLSLTAEYWQNVVSGKTTANSDYVRGILVKVARKAGREYTDATLYAVVDSILGLTSDDYWRDVIAGRRVASGENVRALFGKIDLVIK